MSIPNETLTAIFNELPPTSLTVLARVSYRFNAVAERILYSSIFISDLISEVSPLPWRTLRWCDAMRRRQHLFDTIRELRIRWQADASSPPPQYHYLINPCERVAEVLPPLLSLESLELFLGPANLVRPQDLQNLYPGPPMPPIHPVERAIRHCRFPLLRSCLLGAEWSNGVQPYTTILLPFLESLTSLRHLRLSDLQSNNAQVVLQYLDAAGQQPQSLPFLNSFRGSANAAAALLPARPVQYLSLTGRDSDVNGENLLRMTYTSVPLKSLDLSAMSINPNLLHNVSTHLPTIESLRLKLALRHTLHFAFSGIRLLAGLTKVLRAFEQLAYLDLSPTGIDGVGRADHLQELDLCKQWHSACPSLRRIVFPSQAEWALDLNDDTWSPARST